MNVGTEEVYIFIWNLCTLVMKKDNSNVAGFLNNWTYCLCTYHKL